MKKLLKIILVFAVCVPLIASADVIDVNKRYVSSKPILVNMDKFPDYEFIGYDRHPNGTVKTYVIQSDGALRINYKFDRLNIYAVKKSYLKNKDLAAIDWLADKNVIKSEEAVSFSVEALEKTDPLFSRELYYSVDSIQGNVLWVSKYKQVSHYNNGQPDKVEYFKNNQPTDNPPIITPKTRSFQLNLFQQLGCFFKKILGKGCAY